MDARYFHPLRIATLEEFGFSGFLHKKVIKQHSKAFASVQSIGIPLIFVILPNGERIIER